MTQGAARFTRRYTRPQVDAYLTAVLIDGMAQADAMRAAIAGQLPGVPAFGKYNGKGQLVFGYAIVQTHGQEFVERNPQAEDADTLALLRQGHKANKAALRALPADADPAERTRLMKAVADSRKALASVEPKETRTEKPKASPSEPKNHGTEPNDQLADLLTLVNTPTPEQHDVNTHTDTDNGTRGPVRSVAR